jgi:hypothetical protein
MPQFTPTLHNKKGKEKTLESFLKKKKKKVFYFSQSKIMVRYSLVNVVERNGERFRPKQLPGVLTK